MKLSLTVPLLAIVALAGCSSNVPLTDTQGMTSPAQYSDQVFNANGLTIHGITTDKYGITKFFGQLCSADRNTLVPIQEKQRELCDNQGGTFSLIAHNSGELAGRQTAICKVGTQLRFISLVNKDEDNTQVNRTCSQRNYKRLTLTTLEIDGNHYPINNALGKYIYHAIRWGYVPTEAQEIRQPIAWEIGQLYNSL